MTVASTLKIILAVGGIFIAGAVTGGFVGVRLVDHFARQTKARQQGPLEIGGRLAQQLHLTPEQKEKVRPIITATSEALRKVRREAFSQTAELIKQMDADVSKELTDEQRRLLKELRAKEEERRKQWMTERAKRAEGRSPDRHPGGGMPPPPVPPPEP